MALSVAPSALFISLATADKIAAGGWPLLRRSTPALLGGFALAWTLLGFPYQPGTSMRTLLLTIPYLFLYLVALSVVMYRLGSRIAEQKRELVRLNRTDPTMQLPNRPYFEEVAAAELARAHRAQHPVSLLLIDVDRFKTINDRYGHGMGDVVLKRVAGLLRDSVRGADLPARYGGDEFAVLLVDADAGRAVQVAERIRREAEVQAFDAEPGLRCTLSIGVAQAAADDADLDSWIRAADAALYRAKAAGRNRVAGAGGTRT